MFHVGALSETEDTFTMNLNFSMNGWLLCALGLALSAVVGAIAFGWWQRRQARQRMIPPKRWPVNSRDIVNTQERKTWGWLKHIFFDHEVLVKLPVTRFTLPEGRARDFFWYELLNSLYCSFTVVREDGRVVGCIDLPPRSPAVKRSHRKKKQLLEQCGIPYLVLDLANLPGLLDLRVRFLGKDGIALPAEKHQVKAIMTASADLRDKLTRSRQTRPGDLFGMQTQSGMLPSAFNSGLTPLERVTWQENSFLAPLDSRKAGLR